MLSQSFYKSNLSFITENTDTKSNKSFQLAKTIIKQKQIILEIIYLILGMPGSIVSNKGENGQYELLEKYKMSHLTSLTLKNSIAQAIKMCNQTRFVQQQSKKLYQSTKNAIVKSFCEGVFDYIQNSNKYFSQIISQINNLNEPKHGKITILNICNILQQRSYFLGYIIRCINSCQVQYEKKPQIVRLFDKIWEIQQQLISSSQFNRQQFVKILKRTVKLYFQNVKDWLLMKNIAQSMDFFIKTTENYTINTKKELSEYFLHKNLQLQSNKLPKILENQSYGILQIGKTIRFIRLYYKDYEIQKLMKYLDIQNQFKILFQSLQVKPVETFSRVKIKKLSLNERIRNKNINKIVPNQIVKEQNPYQMFSKVSNSFKINWIQKNQKIKIQKDEKQIINENKNWHGFLFYIRCLLIQILQKINRKCLAFFRDTNDTIIRHQKNRIQTSLTNRLNGIKKFMLLQQGDFVQQFFNAAQDIIDKQKGQVSHNRIYSCIDEAIQNSSAKNLPKQILNNLHFDFIKQSDKKSDRLRVWVLFCFNYHQDDPINYIFHVQMMQKLKDICNFLFKLKKGQILLSKIWNYDRQLVKVSKNKLKVINKGKVLRSSLNTFLNNCVNFVMNKIDVIWSQYIEKIKHAPTVFQMIQQSVEVIVTMQKASTHNNLLYNGSMMTLGLIQKFRKLHEMIKDENMIVPLKQVEQLEFQLRSIAQIVIKIPQLNQIINYNSYFNKFD